MKKHLLFVDHEPRILQRIMRMLTHREGEWTMAFASAPHEAFIAVATQPFDVVVCDMNFPGQRGGAALLEELRDERHEAVRIALSGSSEADDRQAGHDMAHRVISKPFRSEQLEGIIERSYWLRDLYADQDLAALLSETRQLPAVSSTYLALAEALKKREVTASELEAIISQNRALCAKLLQMANSPYFGLHRELTSVHHAIVYLGTRTVRQLVCAVEIFHSFPPQLAQPFDPEALQAHAMLTSRIAADINQDEALADELFLATMLHDIGKLVLASHAPSSLGPMLTQARERGADLHHVEVLHETALPHTRVGAYLLARLGMPDSIIEAVAFHHAPWELKCSAMELPAVLYIANALAHGSHLNTGYLKRLGVADRVETWHALARARRAQFELKWRH